MSKKEHTPAVVGRKAFHCPYCNVLAKQEWFRAYIVLGDSSLLASNLEGFEKVFGIDIVDRLEANEHETHCEPHIHEPRLNKESLKRFGIIPKDMEIGNVAISLCSSCDKCAIWWLDKMIHPAYSPIPRAHRDMPEQVKRYYNEARGIFNRSPRGAMALLRLCIQELCMGLGGSGQINEDIKKFVQEGKLAPLVQQSLDAIRVTGNHAVHPGQIDFNDKKEDAQKLFKWMNFICEKIITEPREMKELFGDLPEKDRQNIEKRDKKVSIGDS